MKKLFFLYFILFYANSTIYQVSEVLSFRLLFGVNEKLLIQHISGPVTKYKLLYVSNQGRARDRGWG